MNRLMDRNELLFEHRFWLQILGDHGRFILNELSPEETEEIKGARLFIETFDNLLQEAKANFGEEETIEFTRKIIKAAQELRAFKLNILRQHLIGRIKLGLSPTFINHMLNELEEYMRIMDCYIAKKIPKDHPVHHHLLWLLDGSGHAAAIALSLDEVEGKLRRKAEEFNRNFQELYMKALEMAGYLRTKIESFPALKRFNLEAELEMKMFMAFLREVMELRLEKEALGTILPLMLDHMFREECYYLTKLSRDSEVKDPECDPTKPRLEA